MSSRRPDLSALYDEALMEKAAKGQTYIGRDFTDTDGTRKYKTYSVDKLQDIAPGQVTEVPVGRIRHLLRNKVWSKYKGRDRPRISPAQVLKRRKGRHWEQIEKSTSDQPIIMTPDPSIADGYHRLARAVLEKRPTIRAQVFRSREDMEPAARKTVKRAYLEGFMEKAALPIARLVRMPFGTKTDAWHELLRRYTGRTVPRRPLNLAGEYHQGDVSVLISKPPLPTALPAARTMEVAEPELLSEARTVPVARPYEFASKVAAAKATGLPDPGDFGDISKLPVGEPLTYVRHLHDALRAGPHADIRIGTPELGLYSWAVPKAYKGMPEPGQRFMALQQPVHEHSYAGFECRLPKGYGEGDVAIVDKGEVVITKVGPHQIKFTTAHDRHPQTYTMTRVDKGKKPYWLMANDTPTEMPEFEKQHYVRVPAEEVDRLIGDPDMAMSAKIDGALAVLKIMKGGARILSHRRSATGLPIEHTARVAPELAGMKFPEELEGEYVGEVYGVRDNAAIPPQELGGLLNSAVARAVRTKRDRGIRTKMMLFGSGRPGIALEDVRADVQKALEHLPGDIFHEPEYAYTEPEKRKLWESVESGGNPLTHEGVVGHPLEGGVPSKVKTEDEADVIVKDIFPGEKRYRGTHAGGFTYEADGKEGRVGTGISDETRKDMHENRDSYIGRKARIRYQEQFPSGAYRAPRLVAFHEG
jgi:hypothetical protein